MVVEISDFQRIAICFMVIIFLAFEAKKKGPNNLCPVLNVLMGFCILYFHCFTGSQWFEGFPGYVLPEPIELVSG